MYNDPNCSPRKSRQWAPPGYASRKDLVEEKRAQEAARVTGLEKDHVGGETRNERSDLGPRSI